MCIYTSETVVGADSSERQVDDVTGLQLFVDGPELVSGRE